MLQGTGKREDTPVIQLDAWHLSCYLLPVCSSLTFIEIGLSQKGNGEWTNQRTLGASRICWCDCWRQTVQLRLGEGLVQEQPEHDRERRLLISCKMQCHFLSTIVYNTLYHTYYWCGSIYMTFFNQALYLPHFLCTLRSGNNWCVPERHKLLCI